MCVLDYRYWLHFTCVALAILLNTWIASVSFCFFLFPFSFFISLSHTNTTQHSLSHARTHNTHNNTPQVLLFIFLGILITLFSIIVGMWLNLLIHCINVISESVPATCTVLRSDIFSMNPCGSEIKQRTSYVNVTSLQNNDVTRDTTISEKVLNQDCRSVYVLRILISCLLFFF